MTKKIKIFIFQNPKSRYSTSIFDNKIGPNDIVFFNSDYGFMFYDLDSSAHESIPINRYIK